MSHMIEYRGHPVHMSLNNLFGEPLIVCYQCPTLNLTWSVEETKIMKWSGFWNYPTLSRSYAGYFTEVLTKNPKVLNKRWYL